MSILLVFAGSFLLYGKSKYFPEHLSYIGNRIKKHGLISRIGAYLLFWGSLFLLANQLGWATAAVAFFIAMTMAYCTLLIILPLNIRLVYLVVALIILTIIIEILL